MFAIRLGPCILAATLLSGCAVAMSNYTANDMRQPDNLRTTVQLEKTVPEVHSALATYQMNCRALGNVVLDPNGSRVVITQMGMGLTNASVYMLVDVEAKGSGAEFKGHAYYATWRSHIDEILNAIKDPKTCA